ncbi:MAG: hypothetical protein R3Y46_01340 [Opitutales bacterium]
MSFKKGYSTESYRDKNKKFRESDKSFSTSNFYDSNKSFYDSNKRVNNSDTYYDANKRAGGLDGSYYNQNKSSLDNKSRFYDDNKELFLDNKDRDLTRGYQGKSDFSKKNDMGESIEAMYGDLMDRSMSDINKYHSQTARQDSTEAGIPVAATVQQKESSILDLLNFSDKKIDNSSVKFSLPNSMKDMGGIGKSSSSTQGTNTSGGQSYREVGSNSANSTQKGGESRASSGGQVQDFSDPNKNYAPVAIPDKSQQANNPYQKKTITVDKPVKEGEERSIFGVPRGLNSGKVQITVEVKPN